MNTPKNQPGRDIMLRYPKLFARAFLESPTPTPIAAGFECGEGWWPIIEDLCIYLTDQRIPLRFYQIKQERGGLCLDYAYTEKVHRETEELVFDAVDRALTRSSHTCEQCGAPGSRQSISGQTIVVCPYHEVLQRRREVKELTEELEKVQYNPSDHNAVEKTTTGS